MDDKITQLRTFFRVSNAAIECISSIHKAFGSICSISKIDQLHKLALEEIEKENPNLSLIDLFLEQIEIEIEKKNQPKPDYPKGSL